ncbi:SDR family oxidoreductase [Mycolicibacterium neworleansense]|uniref:Putative nucleoside-diphosphate sugar epimerase n=1 Tax=Mycolicibacterium neworleansense TaxID=146018 RepID=A0A0H5RYE4_9MYCO|nr:NAD(P)H-binding protein [Mycolicibacterium neworleansense]MCV7362818.1 NAD(P)H-binding protein [Mycolicibacterium neworleansense]CRZ18542.1 putative nucleoside-diphosphate sugar epimerase [Mycolicibacterium neworleansense]
MPRTVLVTGATGTLGHHVVPEATEAGHQVRALSRRDRVGYTGVHWHQADLLKPDSLAAALDGVDVVVHCATQATGSKDIRAARNLIEAARRNGVGHLIYISIVGIEDIPLPYYKTKLRVEQALESSGVGHTILRATQFHELIEKTFSVQRFSPFLWALRGVRFQPIDTRDVATRLVSLIDSEPAGRVADIGGPSIHSHPELGQMYLSAHNSVRRVARFTLPGRIVAGYRSGANLTPENAVDGASFQDYLGTDA